MNRWMIIPAAGSGSRLRSAKPKVLAEVCGRAMIDHLLDLYAPFVEGFVVVLHSSFEDAVREHCAGRDRRLEFLVQERPTGMLDAIMIPRECLAGHGADVVWITWCDQVAMTARTVERLSAGSADHPAVDLLLPTMRLADPYIHFERDDAGRIVRVLQRRESDVMPETGEGDMGLFSLSAAAYFEKLEEFADSVATGGATRERNFLPFIPWIGARGTLRTFPGTHEIESVGINTPEDLRRVEAHLRTRSEG